MNYYSEWCPYAAAWLRNLIAVGLLPPGDVDERDIQDVVPAELMGYTQCHFFAGVGGWPRALDLAGVSRSTKLWTASLPCQPFSAAGKGAGFADERHLWPAFNHLRECCEPTLIMGEQVASPDGLAWWDVVCDDLEDAGYTAWASDMCAASVGAPHIRQRLWWVAYTEHSERRAEYEEHAEPYGRDGSGRSCATGWLANTDGGNPGTERQQCSGEQRQLAGDGSLAGGLGNTSSQGLSQRIGDRRVQPETLGSHAGQAAVSNGDLGEWTSPLNGFWRDADWLLCRDGLWRPVEPGTFPLAHGIPARVGKLRAWGNSIVPEVAAEVIREWMEVIA